MSNLARTYQQLGKHVDAEKLQIEVLNLRNSLLREEHSHTISAINNVAVTYQNLAKYNDAEKLQIYI